jgi:hypothetical protein
MSCQATDDVLKSAALRSATHKLVILCCALYLSGAHWMVLQTAAWTGMIVSRSFTEGVGIAVETTLDGRHPCKMCSAITKGQKEEQQSQKEFELLKKSGDPKFVLPSELPLHRSEAYDLADFCERVQSAQWRSNAPPTPPPLA